MGGDVVIIHTVKITIDEWDPIDLLSHAPSDEYHSEISAIERLLESTSDITVLATGIYNVFFNSFDDVFKKTQSECVLVAKKLLSKHKDINKIEQLFEPFGGAG